MATTDRRQREFAQREALFLDTAQALIQRDGLLNLQMSRIAEECEYAIGTLYRHFSSKEDLLVALATRNCLDRVELFERAARWAGPTRDRIVALALADLIVLREQPEHFRLAQFVWTDVVWGAASEPVRSRALQACEPLAALIEGIAAEARGVGDLPAQLSVTDEGLTIGPWILCLGMHTLAQQQGLLDPALGDPYRLLFRHLHYLLNGYGWQPLFDPGDDDALDRSIERLCRDVFDVPCPWPPR
ncbi:helix-turn-helix domain-containing protein [Luteimonas composti]|uniref:Helix-turn-helix domain-containing protein n=1 Tax=Luteimonas composti TaxID=398257 RepID=A0ABT6MU53_9GAMM|nr:TetR/AcrR family transcriptional regulator [Luteimonas composti]MDH7453791.1 helix-turn-helix domain-containing protein [Luteimonas composti]